MESEEKSTKIQVLSEDDCRIVGKAPNKNKVILNMERVEDKSQGNVFVRLKDEYKNEFSVQKKLLASKKIIGLTLNELKKLSVEEL